MIKRPYRKDGRRAPAVSRPIGQRTRATMYDNVLGTDLAKQLDKLCRGRDVSMASEIRTAVVAHLKRRLREA